MECIVEFDYTASQNDELTIRKGDIIRNVILFEDGWKKGWLNGKEGVFPDNFVRVIDFIKTLKLGSCLNENYNIQEKETSSTVKDQLLMNGTKFLQGQSNSAIDLKQFSASPSPLSGKKHFLINILPNSEKKKSATNSLTLDPITHCKSEHSKSEVSKSLKKESLLSVDLSKENKNVIVIFDYKAENPDELPLNEGEIVKVLDRNLVDDGWWKGIKRTGEIGIFPSNFVQAYQDNHLGLSIKKPMPEDVSLIKASDNISNRDVSNISNSVSFNDPSIAQKISISNKETVGCKRLNVAFKTKNVYANSCSVDSLSEVTKSKKSLDVFNKSQNSIYKTRPLNGHFETSKGDDTSNSLDKKTDFDCKNTVRSRAASPSNIDTEFYVRRSDFDRFKLEVEQKMSKLTIRIQTLVEEIDDEKKQRAASEIELGRLRRIVHMLDAQSLSGLL